jgi:hypothetical protein
MSIHCARRATTGRGYVQDGDRMAADLVQRQFEGMGLKPLEQGWFQEFTST